MKTYFFVLGTNHTLSKIDVVNMLARKGIDFEILEASEEVLLISTSTELDAKSLINELGSAAKIGEIYGLYDNKSWPDNFLKTDLEEKFGQSKFGISVYGAGGKFKQLNEVFYSIKQIAEKLKERQIRGEGRVLSTVAVDKNGLLKEGFELVICCGSKGVYVGKTLAIQDYESYSLRDFGRPARNVKSGMIPPKLAKMMINLARKEKESLFLDPFCGDGTILQELILLGYKNIIGSDLNERAISGAKVNLDWLFKNFQNINQKDYCLKIFQSNVNNLSANISFKSIDAVVTEPFLGSSDRRFFKPEQIKKEVNELENLYLKAFLEFKKILKTSGTAVIVFPVFRFYKQFFYLNILDKMEAIGFKNERFIPEKIKGAELLKLQISNRNSVIYFRPGQSVSREIFTFSLR
ncbi:hypothetical protein COT64_00215 [Candidatus Shapirobacteria bacterium CG09_land_8_20_14_0_10_39_12]|uniref:Ribosomal RNA large subunit methyltransferase K/L-like methyltransferase domain-containing protein n=1 Tax=Candidatus Shapirobacteria bacterium CG09_land_8_20_14_0_10_39_12 TaxID=1974885 RepID=A0A2H0WQF3_9BACT|nr:MAG: hypothetical protein COT64_00215 [Candidatus Shapirobacteria bacterium CG09_land_8_20_14_0_10_39_12]